MSADACSMYYGIMKTGQNALVHSFKNINLLQRHETSLLRLASWNEKWVQTSRRDGVCAARTSSRTLTVEGYGGIFMVFSWHAVCNVTKKKRGSHSGLKEKLVSCLFTNVRHCWHGNKVTFGWWWWWWTLITAEPQQPRGSIFIPFADKSQQLICESSFCLCIVSHVLHNYFAQSGWLKCHIEQKMRLRVEFKLPLNAR